MEEKRWLQLSAFQLRLIAIISMVIDHVASVFGRIDQILVFRAIGRLAFPIFAFQVVEGYCNTTDFKKYFRRLFIFAIISEVPYDFFTGYGWLGPYYQNVLWTFLVGLIAIKLIDMFKKSTKNKILVVIKSAVVCTLAYLIGNISGVDYYGIGVLIVIMFYVTRNLKFKHILQFILLFYASIQLGGQILYEFFGGKFFINYQALCVISLLFIWLYKGKQGYTSKAWRSFCYWFYPVHLIILVLITFIVFRKP